MEGRHATRSTHGGGQRAQLADQLGELLRLERLRAVRKRDFRMRVYLDHQPIGAGCDAGSSDCCHQVPFAGAVAGIAKDGQMRELFEQRDGVDIQREARGRLEGADAALAEHDLVVAAAQDVFGGHEPFLYGAHQAALQEDGVRMRPTP